MRSSSVLQRGEAADKRNTMNNKVVPTESNSLVTAARAGLHEAVSRSSRPRLARLLLDLVRVSPSHLCAALEAELAAVAEPSLASAQDLSARCAAI